jgi:hypothetical protein
LRGATTWTRWRKKHRHLATLEFYQTREVHQKIQDMKVVTDDLAISEWCKKHYVQHAQIEARYEAAEKVEKMEKAEKKVKVEDFAMTED